MQKVEKYLWVLFITIVSVSFTEKPAAKVNWISFEQLSELYAKAPKPILIDLYTDWCGWCKVMDKNTYSNAKVAAYINQHYYAVKYNAESKSDVVFNKTRYSYNPKYKTNDLAIALSDGQLEYPNTIFLAAIDARPAPLAGYMKPKEIEGPLKYFAEGNVNGQTFIEFNKQFKQQW